MKINRTAFSFAIILAAVFVAVFFVTNAIFAATSTNLTSSVVVGIATPVVSGVTLNAGSAITLTPNATTPVSVYATVTDSNGCGEITGGTTTVLLYRSGVTSSTCAGAANNENCYIATAFTASSTCSGGSVTATTTFNVQYFADATDASSSFNGQKWIGTVLFRTPDNTTGTSDSTGQTLNSLLAINVTTSSINYGTIQANTNTGSTDQVATTTNAGNNSSSLQLYALSTLTSAPNSIPTSSQGFATSSFNYNNAASSTGLTSSAVTVTGIYLFAPTSTTNVNLPTFWGLSVPNNQPTGTYTGTTVFQALYHS